MKGKLKVIIMAALLACCFVLPIQAEETTKQCDFHKMEVQNRKKATCTEKGTVVYTCKVCNKTVTKELPKKPHRYVYTDNKNGTHKASCKNCNKVKNADHVYKGKTCVYCKAKRPALKRPVVTSLRNSTDSIKISWNTVKKAKSYDIYRVSEGGSYEKVGTTTKKYWIDKDVKNGASYKYRIYAVNKDGKSDPSIERRACYVDAVGIESLTNEEGRKLKITWKANPVASGYKILYATKKNLRDVKVKYVAKDTTTKTIDKLRKGKTYYVRVCNYKKVNGNRYYSVWSPVKKVTIEK